MKKKYPIACGGHGRVVLETFVMNKIMVDGIVDASLLKESLVFGIKVVGDDSYLDQLDPMNVIVINGFGVSKNTKLRKEKFDDWTLKQYEILGTVHPTAYIGMESIISKSSQIMAGVVLQNGVTVEENAVINTRASIDHDCIIGKHVFISPGVVMCGGVKVESGAFIGAGSVILPGIQIGENAIVGAGSLVNKNVFPNETVFGNPVRGYNKRKV